MTVGQIDREMSSKEFAEWMIYYSTEPFGPAREDFRAALQCSIAANVAGTKSSYDDFIKPWSYVEEQRERFTAENPDIFDTKQEAQIALFKSMMGGR